MTDPVPSKATCHVCDTPDGDHLDWCTPQAREQRPSKDLCSELRRMIAGYRLLGYTAAEHIERLETALRGIQSCSTCEACRGAATLALGGAAPTPLERLQRPFTPDEAKAYKAFINEFFEGPHCSTCGCGLAPGISSYTVDCPPIVARGVDEIPSAHEPAAESALRNCLLMAMRQLHVKHPDSLGYKNWEHIVRFCKEGGVEPSPLRAAQPPGDGG